MKHLEPLHRGKIRVNELLIFMLAPAREILQEFYGAQTNFDGL
jgi:hypothetical protein